MNENHRMTVLEQQLVVLQQEINDVLTTMQKTMVALVNGNRAALTTMNQRLLKLEVLANIPTEIIEGVELVKEG